MKIKFLILILLSGLILNSSAFSKTQKEEYQNDALYSEEYFDYLIECASINRLDEEEKEKELLKNQKKEKKTFSTSEIYLEEANDNESETDEDIDVITDIYTPFKLYIKEDSVVPKYTESFKKVDSKTIIPVGSNFTFFQDLKKTRNKYNSNDYKILAGAEFAPFKALSFAGGLETNFRGIDQNPTSRKLYLSPSFYVNDKVSLSFINKYNPYSGSADFDFSVKVSPFKSKAVDFGLYSGVTRGRSGSMSESINFSTNFYFY